MKKREYFLLTLVAFLIIAFVINAYQLFSHNSYTNGEKLIEKTIPDMVKTLQKGEPETMERVYENLNRLNYPVVLFNLTMDPVVWNNCALNYRGDYFIIKTIDILGNPIGYVGIGDKHKHKKTINILALMIFMLALFFILSFSTLRPLHILFFLLMLTIFFFTGEFLPIVLFFSLLYTIYGKKLIPQEIASIIFMAFAITGFCNIFKNPFIFNNLITFFKTPDFFNWFFVLLLSSTGYLILKPTRFTLIIVFLSIFCGIHAVIFSAFLFLISFIKGRKISLFLLKSLFFSLFLVSYGHFYSHHLVKKFIEQNDFSYKYLKERGKKRLEKYLKLAETKGFANLKDFVERSELKDEDYFAAYINILGEVVESYRNNLPERLETTNGISFTRTEVAGKKRLIVSGSGRFKVGRIIISIASDVYSNPFIKKHPAIEHLLIVKEDKKGFVLRLRGINYFYLLSDLAISFIITITFFLALSFSREKGRLFDRVIFSIYLGFSVIFIVLGLFLFIFSNKIATRIIEKNIAENLQRIDTLIEKEPSNLSEDYLEWLKSIFGVNIGIYGNGVLQLSTKKEKLNLLMPFHIFNKIKWGKNGIYFFKQFVYKGINLPNMPFPAICIKEERDLNPLYNFLRIAAFVFLLIFLVSYLVSYEITKSLVSPLIELSKKAKGVAKGNFEFSINYKHEDEIKELIDSITYMATSLKENYDTLKAIIDNVSSGIVLIDSNGNTVISNRAFNSMSNELKKVALENQEKTEFEFNDRHFAVYRKDIEENLHLVVIEDLTGVIKASKLEVISDMAKKVAHDIKNPLTPIKLNIDYLLTVLKKKEKNIEEILPEVANNILAKVEELKNISSQFSTLFKASRDSIFEEINIREFLEKMAESYPGVEFKISGKGVKIMASKLKLARVFENLIENSLSFSASPEITISIKQEGNIVKVDYRDNGIGIDEKNLEKIFEPYFSTRKDGTGLGLFIAKEFIEEMGGEIKAYSSKKGGHFELKFRKSNS